jgi:hypothetical protein
LHPRFGGLPESCSLSVSMTLVEGRLFCGIV